MVNVKILAVIASRMQKNQAQEDLDPRCLVLSQHQRGGQWGTKDLARIHWSKRPVFFGKKNHIFEEFPVDSPLAQWIQWILVDIPFQEIFSRLEAVVLKQSGSSGQKYCLYQDSYSKMR